MPTERDSADDELGDGSGQDLGPGQYFRYAEEDARTTLVPAGLDGAHGQLETRSQVQHNVQNARPRSGSPWAGGGDTSYPILRQEEPATMKTKRFDYGPEQDFVLHLPPSVLDEHDPTREPDRSGALAAVETCDDRRYYGISPAWQFRQDMTDGQQQELVARRRLRRTAWDSLIIPWNVSDVQLRESVPQLVKRLKAIDPSIDRDDVKQAVFKTIMCREQIRKVHENGIRVGYNNSLRETVFHTKRPDLELKTFRGPNRREEFRRHLRERADAARDAQLQRAGAGAPNLSVSDAASEPPLTGWNLNDAVPPPA